MTLGETALEPGLTEAQEEALGLRRFGVDFMAYWLRDIANAHCRRYYEQVAQRLPSFSILFESTDGLIPPCGVDCEGGRVRVIKYGAPPGRELILRASSPLIADALMGRKHFQVLVHEGLVEQRGDLEAFRLLGLRRYEGYVEGRGGLRRHERDKRPPPRHPLLKERGWWRGACSDVPQAYFRSLQERIGLAPVPDAGPTCLLRAVLVEADRVAEAWLEAVPGAARLMAGPPSCTEGKEVLTLAMHGDVAEAFVEQEVSWVVLMFSSLFHVQGSLSTAGALGLCDALQAARTAWRPTSRAATLARLFDPRGPPALLGASSLRGVERV